jgi:chromosome segregation ATPase
MYNGLTKAEGEEIIALNEKIESLVFKLEESKEDSEILEKRVQDDAARFALLTEKIKALESNPTDHEQTLKELASERELNENLTVELEQLTLQLETTQGEMQILKTTDQNKTAELQDSDQEQILKELASERELNENLTVELQQLTLQLETSQDELQSLRTAFQAKSKKLESALSIISESQAKEESNENLLSALQTLNQTIAEKDLAIDQLEKELESVKMANSQTAATSNEDQQETINMLENEIANLEESFDDAKIRLKQTEKAKFALEAKISDLEAMLESSDNRGVAGDVQDKIDTLMTENEKLTLLVNQLKKKESEKAADFEKIEALFQSENSRLKDALQSMEKDGNDSSRVKEMEQIISQLQQELEDQTQSGNQLLLELEKYEEEIMSLNSECKEKMTVISEYSKRIEELESTPDSSNKTAELEKMNSELLGKIATLSQRLAQADSSRRSTMDPTTKLLAELEMRSRKYQKQATETSKELEEVQKELREAFSKISKISEEKMKIQDELEDLKDINEHLEQNIEVLRTQLR